MEKVPISIVFVVLSLRYLIATYFWYDAIFLRRGRSWHSCLNSSMSRVSFGAEALTNSTKLCKLSLFWCCFGDDFSHSAPYKHSKLPAENDPKHTMVVYIVHCWIHSLFCDRWFLWDIHDCITRGNKLEWNQQFKARQCIPPWPTTSMG